MSNMKNKNNARTGGAVLSPSNKEIEFINTGHAAQSRYLAALANPFASPAVPIPDSFFTAHVAKAAMETVYDNGVDELKLEFARTPSATESTGNWFIVFASRRGSVWTNDKYIESPVGARLVAAGISFEDIGKTDDLEGLVTYTQFNKAYLPGGSDELVSKSERSSRNAGFGTMLYELQRRQALDFEGGAYSVISVKFSKQVNVLARFCAIAECDGDIGFVENKISNKDFVISGAIQNYHAGVFADTPHPDLDHSLIEPAHTDVQEHNSGHHSTALTAAAHWVSSAAGWLWKHRGEAANLIKQAPKYYHSLTKYGGSIMGARGTIMSIGARAAPLAIAL